MKRGFAKQLEKEGKTQARLTLALVGAVGCGGFPGELVEAGAAAVAGPAAGVVLAVALQPARERMRYSRDVTLTGTHGMGSCCVTLLCTSLVIYTNE